MTIKEIDQLLEESSSLKQIAQAYSEIANQKLKKIRSSAERNRLFFDEISKVYGLVRAIASKKGIVVEKPKKRVCVVQTSNLRFYGNIDPSLIEYFVAETRKMEADMVILGKTGIEYFQSNKVFTHFTPIVFKSDQPDASELNSFLDLVKDYNQILIFYSKLKSLLVQIPTITDITENSRKIMLEQKDLTSFIFEPEIAKTLEFFDHQILMLLIEQVFLESEVARTASRFISMDQAETEANKYIKNHEMMRSYSIRNIKNNQLLENIASIIATRNGGIS